METFRFISDTCRNFHLWYSFLITTTTHICCICRPFVNEQIWLDCEWATQGGSSQIWYSLNWRNDWRCCSVFSLWFMFCLCFSPPYRKYSSLTRAKQQILMVLYRLCVGIITYIFHTQIIPFVTIVNDCQWSNPLPQTKDKEKIRFGLHEEWHATRARPSMPFWR